MTDPASDDFEARRNAARHELSTIDPHLNARAETDPNRVGWFNVVYSEAKGDAAKVPWANLKPHPLLTQWLVGQGASLQGLKALDIGCGLGDNAEALSQAGCLTTAFDLVLRAVEWAQERFPTSKVAYHVADLFALPEVWHNAFDLVHECYTLQALPEELIMPGAEAIAKVLRPGGRVLIIARARSDDAPRVGPPWPLTRANLAAFEMAGLRCVNVELIGEVPRWRAVFEKPML